jgi:lipopolysaccharide transport system permease protein
MASIIPVLMFATPIFYSISDVPKHLQLVYKINIVGDYIQMMRDLLLFGRLPDPVLYIGCVLASLIVFAFSYRFFMRYKSVFVDVI